MLKRFFALLALIVLPMASPAATSTAFDAGSVHVDQYGSGSPALVLIPGLTDSGAVWTTAVARYASTHTIYVLTLPGFGGRTPVAAPMLDTVDRDVAAFLPNAGKPVLVGHSMGGSLAIRLAEEHSDLIRGAIAIDGLPVFAGMDKMTAQERADQAARAGARIARATQAQYDAGERQQVSYMTKPANLETALSFGKGANIGATAEYMQELMSADLRPGLSNVTVPLLEIGPFDASIDPLNPYSPTQSVTEKQAYYQQLLAADPAAKVQMVDDSRHFIMLDQPAGLFAAIDAFLAPLQ
jgi:pimeloyl-ACP methyl ester carboxylesterase